RHPMKTHSLTVATTFLMLMSRPAYPCSIRYQLKHLDTSPVHCTNAQLDTLTALLSSVRTFRAEIDMPLTESTLARGTCPDIEDVERANEAWKELTPRPHGVRYTMNKYCMTDPAGVPYSIVFYYPGKVLSADALAKLQARFDYQRTQLIPRLTSKLKEVDAMS